MGCVLPPSLSDKDARSLQTPLQAASQLGLPSFLRFWNVLNYSEIFEE